ncbi:hypothetical protein SBOR_5336 [Sclerotinia borealis F-4128]|uniref:Hsp70 family protein n=1 Tax=Sclerotinia borealis (strain F-4128) TaxID=1432307 RepID=W9CEI4_SCLBF|nr:hypothetical protein SBOR_5336 [Sclerotinia borealis F-4128]
MNSYSPTDSKSEAIATDLPPRHKIIVAVDYGTTYSGVCYVQSTAKSFKDVVCINSWLGSTSNNKFDKAPTRIAYPKENKTTMITHPRTKLKLKLWGFQVKPKLISCSWTKLLDKNARPQEYDDVHSTEIDQGMMHLPPSLTANCWITLPAIWSEEAKYNTLSAAKSAGFGNRLMDEIHTIAEPEAAAIATLKDLTTPDTLNAVQRGDNILICDAGGGTVDVTTYTVTSVVPRLEFEELCGGKCGSTFIDRHLHDLLSKRFGDTFKAIPYSMKGPGSRFMDAWELLKRDFGRDNKEHPRIFELGQLNLKLPSSQYYESLEFNILLSHRDMETLFDLVKEQVNEAHERKQAKIHRIVLVGELGSSRYLYNALSDWCSSNGEIQILCSRDPITAVMRGAAIRGLEGIAPRLKYARRHYGFEICRKFRNGIDDETYAYIDDFSNEKYCTGRLMWCVDKGDEITEGELRSKSFARVYTPGKEMTSVIRLYSCAADSQPERIDNPRVEEINKILSVFPSDFNFGIDCDSRYNPRLHKTVHQFHFQVQVIFGDRGSNLQFRTVVGGRVMSGTTIEFPEH